MDHGATVGSTANNQSCRVLTLPWRLHRAHAGDDAGRQEEVPIRTATQGATNKWTLLAKNNLAKVTMRLDASPEAAAAAETVFRHVIVGLERCRGNPRAMFGGELDARDNLMHSLMSQVCLARHWHCRRRHRRPTRYAGTRVGATHDHHSPRACIDSSRALHVRRTRALARAQGRSAEVLTDPLFKGCFPVIPQELFAACGHVDPEQAGP